MEDISKSNEQEEDKEEKIYDVYGIKYNSDDARSLRLSREVKKEINRMTCGFKGRSLIIKEAFLYKQLLKHRIWMDEQITELEKKLAESNCEVYFTEDSSLVVARDVVGSKDKVVFVEALNYSNANRARDFILGKDLKGRNIS